MTMNAASHVLSLTLINSVSLATLVEMTAKATLLLILAIVLCCMLRRTNRWGRLGGSVPSGVSREAWPAG